MDSGRSTVSSNQSPVASRQTVGNLQVAESTPEYAGESSSGDRSAATAESVQVPAAAVATAARVMTANGAPRHLRIFFERTNDQDEDVRRMRELLNLLRSKPGRDRFTFFVPNPQGTVQLDFPNFTTSYAAVQEPLNQMVSEWGSMEVQ